MDVSAFDFKPAELAELLVALAEIVQAIDVEPRLHQEDEEAPTADGVVKLHEGLSGPTFRLRVRPRGGDKILAQLGALDAALGVSAVLDADGWVRLRHVRAEGAAS